MPEMVLDGDDRVDVGNDMKAISNRDRGDEPPPDPVNAPKGWRRDRKTGEWVPRKRAAETQPQESDNPPAERPESAWVDGPDGAELADDERKAAPRLLSGDERADLEAILELFALPVIAAVDSRDPYCGGAVVEHWDNIRDKAIPIIARSPMLVEWMTKAGGMRDWMMLAAALQPVGHAIYRHHISHTVTTEQVQAGGPVRGEQLDAYQA